MRWSAGGGHQLRGWIAVAFGLIACLVTVLPSVAAEIPRAVEDRMTAGLITAMDAKRDEAFDALAALASLRVETEDKGSSPVPGLVARIMLRADVRDALRRTIKRSGADQQRYITLSASLPGLADAIGEALGDQPLPDEILRRSVRASPSVQGQILARAIDPRNTRAAELIDRILADTGIVGDLRAGILGRLSGTAGVPDREHDFALRYAAATAAPIPAAALRRGLGSHDAGALRVVTDRIASFADAEAAAFADGLDRAIQTARGIDLLERLFRLRLRLAGGFKPEDLATLGKGAFWTDPERAVAMFNAAAERADGRAILARGVPDELQIALRPPLRCHTVPALLDLDASSPASGLAPRFVIDILVRAASDTDFVATCDAHRLGEAIDRWLGRIASDATAVEALRGRMMVAKAPPDRPPAKSAGADRKDAPAVLRTAEILRAAVVTRTALTDPGRILNAMTGEEEPAPLVAALVGALPDDHPLLGSLRAALAPAPSESLSDSARRRPQVVARILRSTARPTGWGDADLDRVVALALDAEHPATAQPAFDTLVASRSTTHLLAYFDAVSQSVADGANGPPSEKVLRATRAFAQAAQAAGPSSNAVFTAARVNWLLALLPNEGLRGRVAAALSARPAGTALAPDPVDAALARLASPGSQAGRTTTCAQLALLGPFAVLGPALRLIELAAAEDYEGERWRLACMSWLGPATADGRSTASGLLLNTMIGDAPLTSMPWDDASGRLAALATIWSAAEPRPLGKLGQRKVAEAAAAIAPHLGYGLDGVTTARAWDERLSKDFPEQAGVVRREGWKRTGLLVAGAIPGALALHLALWGLMVAAYPRWPALRSHVFYNPVVRKMLGLGYVDVLLTWIAPLRRLMFEPFRPSLLGELDRVGPEAVGQSYFPRSGVTHLPRNDLDKQIREAERQALSRGEPARETEVTQALRGWRGPTVLFGPSGRGKTSFLRHILTAGGVRFPFVYLRAMDCGTDPLGAIRARLPGLGHDRDLVASLVHAGRFDVYIDGLNEVEREVQEGIVQFLVEHRTANIFIASQEVGITLPSRLETWFLLPLARGQMQAFLASREPLLDAGAPVRGQAYQEKCRIFIDELAAAAGGDGVPTAAATEGGKERGKEPELAASFLATLANPMDLETAAILLSLDVEPDPFRLQQQQFRLACRDFTRHTQREFPIEAFSRAVLDNRKSGKPEIDSLQFDVETAVLVARKQVRKDQVPLDGGKARTEYRFRHDKIRDFFAHLALLGDDPTERYELARDDRFSGVYEYLARELPSDQAADLREFLLSAALDRNDHRLSDRFMQHMRWRALLNRQDPAWLAEFDGGEARSALRRFTRLSDLRDRIETAMRSKRDIVERDRIATRLLAAEDAEALEDAVGAALVEAGARPAPSDGNGLLVIETPTGRRLALLCVAGQRCLTPLSRIGTEARCRQSPLPKLVVVNPQAREHPDARDWGILEAWADDLRLDGGRVVSSRDILSGFRSARDAGDYSDFWLALLSADRGRGSGRRVMERAS